MTVLESIPTTRNSEPDGLPDAREFEGELVSIEICAGAGGQALGLEKAGFSHAAVVEIDHWAAATLRLNRPEWNVLGPLHRDDTGDPAPGDVHAFDASPWRDKVHLLAGGVPCPPFSAAGKQLGADDERDLFPQAIRIAEECRPIAIMLENVRGLMAPKFDGYREALQLQLEEMGYRSEWRLLHASNFGVPQLRPRAILVALPVSEWKHFEWPEGQPEKTPTVGDFLHDLMSENGWKGADDWRELANRIGPTLVGGSKKHGGPDLGPTRARAEWGLLGVDGRGLANAAPGPGFSGEPRLTVRMAARLQGFPDDWVFAGRKTASYRQVGNAFPPPVAEALGVAIRDALFASAASNNTARAVAA